MEVYADVRNYDDFYIISKVVLREELLLPGVTTTIELSFVVSDLHLPVVFRPITITHNLTVIPLPPPVVLHLWFDTPVLVEDTGAFDHDGAAAHADTVKQLIMGTGFVAPRFWVGIQPTLLTPMYIVAVTVYGHEAADKVVAQVESEEGINILEGQ